MANSQSRHDEDFIKRAQACLKNIDERTEQLRKELHLPPEEKYVLASLMQEKEASTDASVQIALPKAASARRSRLRSVPVLATSTAIGIGLLIFGLGLAITQVSGTNTAFATPLATLVTAIILACIVSIQTQRGWSTLLPAWSGKNSHYFSAAFDAFPMYSSVPMPERKEMDSPQSRPRRKEKNASQLARPAAKTRAKKEELWKDKGVLLFVALSLIAVSVASMFLNLVSTSQARHSGNTTVSSVESEPTGLSYGKVAFDIHRTDGELKLQAARKLKDGDTNGAISLWNQAVSVDRSDAEAHIYLENTRVLLSRQPHMTLATATLFTKGVTGLGRDDLQGAYIAQKEYNEQAQKVGGKQLLLLVAVASDDPVSVANVAQQIVEEAHHDSTILGVMGWPTSTSALAAVKVLANAHIPLVSESATSDALTGISPYFFRMGTDTQQATFGAKYALKIMKVKRVAVFEDPANAYSKSLADAFTNTFTAEEQHTVVKQFYTVKQSDSLKGPIQDVIQEIKNQQVDMIYMSGYAADTSTLLAALPQCESSTPCVQVMGGDALNTQGDYTTHMNISRVHFTAFAYAKLWEEEGKLEPAFFKEYQAAFSGRGLKATADTIVPDSDTILAFDALNVLLQGCEQLQGGDKQDFTPENLKDQLTKITLSGVSGSIHFDKSNGNAVDKAVVMLHIKDAHDIEHDQQP
jgi:ABC-type branched-subunit amino acid transport system substrate-binding protein